MSTHANGNGHQSRFRLSDTELQMLRLAILRHLSNKEIAREMTTTHQTVKNRWMRIYRKLGVRGREWAMLSAWKRGLIE